ncbi:MAG TPA: hypothetical protein DCX79_05545 [Planctomycetaceae bacterium]|nr:hypothetical protein [Planctomycetaceae bacterium]
MNHEKEFLRTILFPESVAGCVSGLRSPWRVIEGGQGARNRRMLRGKAARVAETAAALGVKVCPVVSIVIGGRVD